MAYFERIFSDTHKTHLLVRLVCGSRNIRQTMLMYVSSTHRVLSQLSETMASLPMTNKLVTIVKQEAF